MIFLKESLSVFFLCYNDSRTIGEIIEKTYSLLKNISNDFEIIVVNDGSIDNSRQVLEALKEKYSCLRLAHHLKNRGYGAAIQTGFKACTKELIFYTDGDGQYDISDLPKLLNSLDGADMVNGYLDKRADPFYRIFLGNIYKFLQKYLFKININYVDCDFRLFRRKVIENINVESNSGFICVEMIRKILDKGYTIKEVCIRHYPRLNGRSQFFTIPNILKLFYDAIIFYASTAPKPRLLSRG